MANLYSGAIDDDVEDEDDENIDESTSCSASSGDDGEEDENDDADDDDGSMELDDGAKQSDANQAAADEPQDEWERLANDPASLERSVAEHRATRPPAPLFDETRSRDTMASLGISFDDYPSDHDQDGDDDDARKAIGKAMLMTSTNRRDRAKQAALLDVLTAEKRRSARQRADRREAKREAKRALQNEKARVRAEQDALLQTLCDDVRVWIPQTAIHKYVTQHETN